MVDKSKTDIKLNEKNGWLSVLVKLQGQEYKKAVGEDQFEKDLNYINRRFLLNKCIEIVGLQKETSLTLVPYIIWIMVASMSLMRLKL